MATATNTDHRIDFPKFSYQSLDSVTAGDDPDTPSLDWELGVSSSVGHEGMLEQTKAEERINLLPGAEIESNGLFDRDSKDVAFEAAEQMTIITPESLQSHPQVNQDTGVLSTQIERTYLHCYTAASIGLLCLSVTSFILPSISTYPPERTAVQALSYTAGVISLLSGLAAGASVVAAYTGSGYLHR